MYRPVHFEIHAADVPAARAFYETALGWAFEDWSEYAGMPYLGATTGEGEMGINGALMQRAEGQENPVGGPVNGAVLTMGVDDYDAVAEKILAAGGEQAVPKHALPGMAWQGYFRDVDGNVFGIHQPDPEAA